MSHDVSFADGLSIHSNSMEEDEKEAKLDILAQEEERIIRLLRSTTMSVLAVSSISMCFLVYFYLRHEETENLEESFREKATQVVSTFRARLKDRVNAIDYLSLSLISHSISMKIEWPKLFLPHFEVRGNKTNALAGTISTTVLPIVTNKTRPVYEGFSNMMQRWVPEGLAFQERWGNSSWKLPQDWDEQVGKIPPTITSRTTVGEQVVASGQGPFLPRWQSSPALSNSSFVSLDLLSHPAYKEVLNAGLESGRVLFGKSFLPFESEDEEAKHDILKMYLNKWEKAGIEYKDDAIADLVYPLYDDFFGEPTLVGLFHSHVYWRNYFTDALPDGDGPLNAFLTNSCGQEFAFEIDGSGVTYHGNGKIRFDSSKDPKLSKTATFSEMMGAFKVAETVQGECSYTLHLQASSAMESRYKTSNPIYFTLGIAAAVLFTSLTFIAYDFLIEQRQKKVMRQAVKSGAIVSSLFPKAVRARIYADANEQLKDKQQKKGPKSTDIPGSGELELNDNSSPKPHFLSSDPVADLYPECTILFADVVGFTSWSAKQSPTSVFKLLETLYFNFDRRARQLKVFKVETIGDCYVAATGIPNAQPRHAIIMAQFANDCLTRMHSLLPELEESLGSGVMELSMRFGLHSGTVTAGVLRGDKGRFQLFGDTVNTAARMESNGVKGRIHVSESTAQLVRRGGYPEWVTPREDKITAKGKGEMQTFWLLSRETSAARASSFNTDAYNEGSSSEAAA